MSGKCKSKHPEYCAEYVEYDEISKVVDLLCDDDGLKEISVRDSHSQSLPSKEAIIEAVELLKRVLLPGYFDRLDYSVAGLKFNVGAALDRALQILQIQIMKSLCFSGKGFNAYKLCNNNSKEIVREFLLSLPKIREYLSADIKSAYLGDPAATCVDETIFCYPGILAMIYFRIAHEFYKLEVPLLPRIITEHAHSLTGIDIHPGATVGKGLFIDHGTGVVIGETAIIGEGVSIYQGVTLGAKSFPLDENGNAIGAKNATLCEPTPSGSEN
jgi:serine O-acetyltransferase